MEFEDMENRKTENEKIKRGDNNDETSETE